MCAASTMDTVPQCTDSTTNHCVLWVHPRNTQPESIPQGAIAVSDDPWVMHSVLNRLQSRGYGKYYPITLMSDDQSTLTLFAGFFMTYNMPFFTAMPVHEHQIGKAFALQSIFSPAQGNA